MKKLPIVFLVLLGFIIVSHIAAFGGQYKTSTTTPPTFAAGTKISASGSDIHVGTYVSVPCASLALLTGPVKLDWNEDGMKDLLDGTFYYGSVYYFQNINMDNIPDFTAGTKLYADGSEISVTYG
jgi:hypothetical protein